MLQAARRAAPSLLLQAGGSCWAPLGARPVASAPQRPSEEDDDAYELLPPGCSLKDPTYGRSFGGEPGRNSLSDPVLNYDHKPVEEYRPLKKTRQPVPQAPLNVAAAQAKLQETKQKAGKDEDDFYVYLPPGSSMRDPLPSSLSGPLDRQKDRKVYYRDPNPTLRK